MSGGFKQPACFVASFPHNQITSCLVQQVKIDLAVSKIVGHRMNDLLKQLFDGQDIGQTTANIGAKLKLGNTLTALSIQGSKSLS